MPVALKVFLTALAILDDLGAILVIAVFYPAGWTGRRSGWRRRCWPRCGALRGPGCARCGPSCSAAWLLWAAVHRSGIHATLAGVALAFVRAHAERPTGSSPAQRLEHALDRWVAFLILPLFGLANAGLQFTSVTARTVSDPVFLGIAGGLLLGKQVGVFGATMARLPRSSWSHLRRACAGGCCMAAACCAASASP